MEDELLRALGRQQRRDPSSDPAMTPNSTDAEALLRPFDAEEREALLDRVMDRLDAAEPRDGAAEVVDLQAKRARSPAVVVLAALVAVAAGLLLWFVMRTPASTGEPEVAMLPAYSFTQLRGGTAEKRAGDERLDEIRLRADDAIDFWLSPAQPVRGEVEVALLAEPERGATQLVPLPDVRVSTSGAIRIEGTLQDHVALEPGVWTLTVLIAAPGGLPDDVEAARADPNGRWQTASVRAIIVPP